MNAPDRYELLVVPDNLKKVTLKKDTKIPNAATFEIQREDHTVGNMLRAKLLESNQVIFAGYRMPHPLNPMIEIKVQTRKETTPMKVVIESLLEVINECNSIDEQFQKEISRVKSVSTDDSGW